MLRKDIRDQNRCPALSPFLLLPPFLLRLSCLLRQPFLHLLLRLGKDPLAVRLLFIRHLSFSFTKKEL